MSADAGLETRAKGGRRRAINDFVLPIAGEITGALLILGYKTE